jgi:putative oxidoreductase
MSGFFAFLLIPCRFCNYFQLYLNLEQPKTINTMNSPFTKIARILLGIILLAFGLNKFFTFIPLPDLPTDAKSFMESLGQTGYILQVVAVLEILIGLMLIAKKWVAFALILLAPISANILFFHLFLDLPGLSAAILVVALNVILIYKHWKQYTPLFH